MLLFGFDGKNKKVHPTDGVQCGTMYVHIRSEKDKESKNQSTWVASALGSQGNKGVKPTTRVAECNLAV